MLKLFKQNREIILYLIFGVLTTLVNIIVYVLFTRVFMLNEYVANTIAWLLSVLFAYITNRKYVFECECKTIKDKMKEVLSFYTWRLVTFGIDMLLMFVLIDLMYINDMVSKIAVNIIVIILNYIFSKFITFKK